MKVFIDPGHRNNQNDYGASGNGLKESALALSIALKLRTELERRNIVVYMSRTSEKEYLSLTDRIRKANNLKPDLFISIHINWYSKVESNGIEVLYFDDKDLAKDICDRMCHNTGATNRGAKPRTDLRVLKETSMTAILVECGFISNVDEAKKLSDGTYQGKLVKGIADAIIAKYKIVVPQSGTSIIAHPSASEEQCRVWAQSKNATTVFINNIPTYFKVCKESGVNPVLGVAQYAKETGYGKFGGVLDETYKNPCGLKIPQGGDCKDPQAHKRFSTWEEGIKAHLDHLGLYAGTPGYPKKNTPDPRHFAYLIGKCKTVESLGGNWCPSTSYGTDLLIMMGEIAKMVVQEENSYLDDAKLLNTEGIINTLEAWEDENKINVQYVPALIKNMAAYIRNKKL
ncbi:MAG: N-acetylmuramoyl-L-alanine amidase [Candidatus Niameybacter stercoravium]|nr:N-acetylmuramoyl-L-alanine amidase [Candidatus Niameybacter stercoravium]